MKKKLTAIFLTALIAAGATAAQAGTIVLYTGTENIVPIKFDTDGEIRSSLVTSYSRDNPLTTTAKSSAYDAVVPERIDGYSVQSVAYLGFYDDDRLRSISLPSSLTSIGKKAFYGADLIDKFDLTYVEEIGEAAFYSCDSLTDVVIGDKISEISSQAFMNNKALTNVEFGKKVITIGSQAFAGCTSLADIKLPSDVKTIGDSAFKNCTSLKKAVLPIGTTTIEANAFSGCTSLETVYIPATVTSIGKNAFKDCTSLESIYIPYDCKSIDYSFLDNTSNATVYCADGSRAAVLAESKGLKTGEYTDYVDEDLIDADEDIDEDEIDEDVVDDIIEIIEDEEEADDTAEDEIENSDDAVIIFDEEDEEADIVDVIEAAPNDQNIHLYVNGSYVECGDALPTIKNNRTLVPMRPLFEALNVSVAWDEINKSVTCQKDDTTIVVTIGSTTALVNGKQSTLEAAPEIINGYTYVPVRFLSENLGMNVGWNSETKSVTVFG